MIRIDGDLRVVGLHPALAGEHAPTARVDAVALRAIGGRAIAVMAWRRRRWIGIIGVGVGVGFGFGFGFGFGLLGCFGLGGRLRLGLECGLGRADALQGLRVRGPVRQLVAADLAERRIVFAVGGLGRLEPALDLRGQPLCFALQAGA